MRITELEQTDQPDTICVDVPLFIRLLEYAREDAKTDMDLHTVTENIIRLSQSGQTLSMDDYESIVKVTSDGMTKANEGKGYTIDQDDMDEFSPEECNRIKNSHFPDTLRNNLRIKRNQDKQRIQRASWSNNDGGSSSIGSPQGGNTSSNDY